MDKNQDLTMFSNDKLNIEDKGSVVVITLSGSEDHLGKILEVNNVIYRVFQYKKHEILGQNVKKLQPFVLAEVHDGYLYRFYKKTEFSNISPVVFGETKQQYLIQLYSKVTLHPTLSDGIKIIGYLKETPDNKKVLYLY